MHEYCASLKVAYEFFISIFILTSHVIKLYKSVALKGRMGWLGE